MKRKIFSLSLAAALLLGLLPCAFAQDDVLHISTVEELEAFAVDCTLVEYSVGLKVQLDGDLDLEGRAFNPIPSFSGSFDGGGHTISNFVLGTDGSHQGFFRYLQSEGSIKNLSLEGRVEPDNSRCQVGGLVGSSYGTIENCSFSGKVTGLNYVGGIAGENYGSIKDCKSEGSVSGKRFTGGIAGCSYGSIENCENRSEVNTGISAGGLEIDKLNVEGLTLTGAEDTDVVSDSGGIVGFSSGVVKDCMNLGTVGYPHYGYNVGGIAGRQSGHIASCSNLGEIYGRKDVAGIVGQMEPYLKLLSSASLADEIRTLQAMVANAGYLGDEVRNALANISNTAGQTIEDMIFNDWSSLLPDPGGGTTDPGGGTTDPGSGTTDPGGGTTDPDPGTTDPGGGTTDPGGGTTDPDPGTTDPDPGTTEPGATNPDPGAAVPDPGADAAGASAIDAGQSGPAVDSSADGQDGADSSDQGTNADGLSSSGSRGGIVPLSAVEPGSGTTDPDSGTADPGSGTADPGTGTGSSDSGSSGGILPTPSLDTQALKENLDRMASDAQYFNAMLGATADSVKSDLSAVSYQLSKVLIMMANTLSGEKEINIYDDVSVNEPKTSTDGRVKLCVNRGKVEGDSNVGGIAGDMGVEYEFDLENELMSVFTASNIISSSYQSKCISSENINYGDILAKKDNAGGIAGQCQVGLVEDCRDYGSVSSEEGSCVGGIVGRSMTLIRNSYAMSSLNGQEYVGGIAGYGVEIRDCASLVSVGDVSACCGCIAGWADMSAGLVENNVYSHPSLGAVDGISYSGKAQALDYDSLLKTQGVPEEFGDLKISFVADGELVAELPFSYGGSIDESQLPQVPEKPGYIGSWAEYDYSSLYLSDTVEAVYSYRQGTLAVDNPDPEEDKAIVLVEGDFDSSGRLSLREFTGEGPELEKGSLREKWALSIENGGSNREYSVHYLSPEPLEKWSRIELYAYSDGSWSKLDTVSSGSYLVFNAQGDTVVFCSVETEKEVSSLWLIGGGVLIAGAALAVALRLGRKKKAGDMPETASSSQ